MPYNVIYYMVSLVTILDNLLFFTNKPMNLRVTSIVS